METINNYEISLQNAMKRFGSYDMATLSQRSGVTDRGAWLQTRFFGMETSICKKTGQVTVDGEPADFCEALSVFDWLCDGRQGAKASGEFAPISSLPGVLVRGQGLLMSAPEIAKTVDLHPEIFRRTCEKLGGRPVTIGDIAYEIPVFPDITVILKFYHGDEEFPPDMTFLWDKNILQFVRYETVYYLAATVKKYLKSHLV